MNQSLLAALILLLAVVPGRAFGQRSCLPDYTALQAFEVVSASEPHRISYPLLSERSGNRFTTKVLFVAEPATDDAHVLQLKILFDPLFDGVSLPYNLYAVQIIQNGEVALWEDFTFACRGPGLSFFPGREIRLPAVKLIGDKPQKLQIMVWGRL